MAPLSEEDSRDVFLSHVVRPAVALEVRETWEQETSPIRQLIRLSGRHPQSLQLLAGQLRRPGMDLTKLRDEAHANLLDVLKDPYATDDDDDRQLRARHTFELSYRHLSDPARNLFARLSRLPAGIWCGEMPERFIEWEKLLGDDWKQVIEKELDYFSVGHFEDGPEGTSFFRMLPAMVELSAEKFQDLNDDEWEKRRAQFWKERLSPWNALVSGNNLGNVQSAVGERAAAQVSYEEALEIYWPLCQKTPQAYGQNFFTALHNYTKVAPETPDDRWWQLWKTMQQTSQEGPESEEAKAV